MECCLHKIKKDDVITGILFMHSKGHWFYYKFSLLKYCKLLQFYFHHSQLVIIIHSYLRNLIEQHLQFEDNFFQSSRIILFKAWSQTWDHLFHEGFVRADIFKIKIRVFPLIFSIQKFDANLQWDLRLKEKGKIGNIITLRANEHHNRCMRIDRTKMLDYL